MRMKQDIKNNDRAVVNKRHWKGDKYKSKDGNNEDLTHKKKRRAQRTMPTNNISHNNTEPEMTTRKNTSRQTHKGTKTNIH